MIVILIHRWHLLMRFQYYSELTKCDYLTIEWFIACKYGFAINPSCFQRSNIRQQFQLRYLTNSELLSLRWSLLFQIIKMQFAINCHLISIVPHLHCLLFDIQLSTVHILLIILQIIVNSYLLFEYKYFLINLLELILFDIWKELVGRGHYDF